MRQGERTTEAPQVCVVCGEPDIPGAFRQVNLFRWYVVERDGQRFTFTDGSSSGDTPRDDFDGLGRLVAISNGRVHDVVYTCNTCERAKEFCDRETLIQRSWRPWPETAD